MPDPIETQSSPVPEGGQQNVSNSSTEPTADFFEAFGAVKESTVSPASETPNAESPAGEEGTVPDGQEDTGVDEATTLREQVSHMAAIMAEHGITFLETGTPEAQASEGTTPETQTPATPAPVTAQAPTWGPTVVVSDEDFQASLENKAVFEKLLTTVRDQAVERTVQSIPQLVTTMVKQQLYLNELSREFYQANEDLAGIRPFVGVVANEIASKNPGLKPEEVLAKTAIAVRERMALKSKVVNATPPVSPGLPNPSNRPRVSTPNLSGLEKDLADLMEVK